MLPAKICPFGFRYMSLEEYRKRIDELDEQLVELLNERARVVVEIG